MKKLVERKSLIELFEQNFVNLETLELLKADKLKIGDTVAIQYKTFEETKEKIINFSGYIISFANKGVNKTVLVRTEIQGVGVEQIFLLHSPKIIKIEKTAHFKARRAKLYFFRKKQIKK
jgi:large subunit ribosomal protein L19